MSAVAASTASLPRAILPGITIPWIYMDYMDTIVLHGERQYKPLAFARVLTQRCSCSSASAGVVAKHNVSEERTANSDTDPDVILKIEK